MRSRLLSASSLFAAIAVILLNGCGSGGLELGSVSGVVTMDDRPLADATVEFTPSASDAPAEEASELNFDDFTPAEATDPSEAATMEFSAMPAAAADDEIDFGLLGSKAIQH